MQIQLDPRYTQVLRKKPLIKINTVLIKFRSFFQLLTHISLKMWKKKYFPVVNFIENIDLYIDFSICLFHMDRVSNLIIN